MPTVEPPLHGLFREGTAENVERWKERRDMGIDCGPAPSYDELEWGDKAVCIRGDYPADSSGYRILRYADIDTVSCRDDSSRVSVFIRGEWVTIRSAEPRALVLRLKEWAMGEVGEGR